VYDLVIVGAGPAGCAAAIQSLREGLTVCLLEYMTFPRFRPGETLSPGTIEAINNLTGVNLLENSNAILHTGFDHIMNGTKHYHSYGGSEHNWDGIHIERSVLDSILLKTVIGIEPSIVKQTKALKLIQQEERISILTSEETIKATYIIDASGANSFVRRQLGITNLIFSKPLPIKYRYVENLRQQPNTSFLIDNTGWVWQATVSKSLEVECRLFFPNSTHSPSAPIERKVKDGEYGANGTWRIAEQLAGESYFLVGDSACMIDPACSHGILRAILSGTSAATAVAKCLRDSTNKEQTKYAYCDWLTGWFFDDCFQLNNVYASVSHTNDPIGFLSRINHYYPTLRAWI